MTTPYHSQPAPDTAAVSARTRRRTTTPRGRRRGAYGATRRLASGRWQARYTDTDGTRRPAPRTFATEREAEDWITTHRAAHLSGQWRSPEIGAQSLSDYLTEYLASRVDLAPATQHGYAELARVWLLADLVHPTGRRICLAPMALRDITPATVREWYAAVQAEGQRRAERRAQASDRRRAQRARHAARDWARAAGLDVAASGRLPATVLDAWRASGAPGAPTLDLPATVAPTNAGQRRAAHAYALLRLVLGTAHRDGLILASPCTLRGAGSTRTPERPHATPEEVAQLAEAMPPRYAAAVLVAAWSGLRAGELFALTRAHVDTARGTVRVERALLDISGQPLRFGPPKTTASQRTVHLPRPVSDALAVHLASHTAPGPDALVFTTEDGAPVDKSHRLRAFHAARAETGLHRLRWHDLRHTGATQAAQAGASLRELQARLGHSTVAAAMTYQHATAERDRDLAERMAAAVPTPATVTPLRLVTGDHP